MSSSDDLSRFQTDITDMKVAIGRLTVMQENQTERLGEIKGEFLGFKNAVQRYAFGFIGGIWALVVAILSIWATVHFTGHP